jgi:hypothetical protein
VLLTCLRREEEEVTQGDERRQLALKMVIAHLAVKRHRSLKDNNWSSSGNRYVSAIVPSRYTPYMADVTTSYELAGRSFNE